MNNTNDLLKELNKKQTGKYSLMLKLKQEAMEKASPLPSTTKNYDRTVEMQDVIPADIQLLGSCLYDKVPGRRPGVPCDLAHRPSVSSSKFIYSATDQNRFSTRTLSLAIGALIVFLAGINFYFLISVNQLSLDKTDIIIRLEDAEKSLSEQGMKVRGLKAGMETASANLKELKHAQRRLGKRLKAIGAE